MSKELTPREVLIDLFEEEGLGSNPETAADVVIRRLTDAGFTILDLKRDEPVPKAALDWLFGAGPDAEGRCFGECEGASTPLGAIFPRPRYWWRSKFRSMIPALNR